jgi:hypothetical protein
MFDYTVSLKFDINAKSQREAAEKLQILARDVEHYWNYEVIDNLTKKVTYVDLDLDED